MCTRSSAAATGARRVARPARAPARRRRAAALTTFATFTALAATALPATACDLKAEFLAPAGGTHNGAKPLTWELRFSNVGSAGDCPANQVRLVRQQSDPPQALIGAVGPVALRALAPRQALTLRLVETAPPKSGTHVYRPAYESKFADPDEGNHHPVKSLTFHAAYTLGG